MRRPLQVRHKDETRSPLSRAAVWTYAFLSTAFHRDYRDRRRAAPVVHRARGGEARIGPDPRSSESFVHVKGVDPADDVQIKLHPARVVVRRNGETAWSAVAIEKDRVVVRVGDTFIEVDATGGVSRHAATSSASIEGDGAILAFFEGDEDEGTVGVAVSKDGSCVSRHTDCDFDVIAKDGAIKPI